MCNTNNPEGGHKCCGWLSGNKYRHHALRTLFWVVVVLGFVTVVAVGLETARGIRNYRTAAKYVRAGYQVRSTGDGYRILPRVIYRQKTEIKTVTVFGQIKKVEANQITILNNGAVEQVVISLPETRIYLDNKLVGIASLAENQQGLFNGVYNAAGQLEAKVMELVK